MKMRFGQTLGAVLVAAFLTLPACRSPFSAEQGDDVLRRRVAGAIDRELAGVPDDHRLLETTQPPGEVEVELAGREADLAAIGPKVPFPEGKLDLGPDLTGARQQEVALNLKSVIESAVRNNLSIQLGRLQPAINASDVVAAEAAFDAVFLANINYDSIDEPTVVPAVGMPPVPVGTPTQVNEQWRFETGVRQRLTSGGEVFVTTDLSRFDNRTPGLALVPDPSYTAAVRLGITQPLLRGFGTSVNTASIRLARNAERGSIQQLRLDLLNLLEATEAAYWSLVFAWQDLAIQEWLLEVGIQVRDIMDRRRDFDTKPAQYSDAVATVETRKALTISARRDIRFASDRLKVLMNDPQLTVGSEALLVPADAMIESPIRYNLREAVITAVANRPEIEQAVLGIDDSAIRQMLADNNRLPLLNVSAQMDFFGLDNAGDEAYSNLFDGNFVDYLLGLAFEYPIGNRAAEAGYRRARLERSSAVIAYQRAVQDVILDVKNALRDCITNYELIQANRSSRIAAAENLRALLVEEETLAALTPEFLNLKFQRQDRLAAAQRDETASLVSYNTSVASLYRTMGIGLSMNQIQLEIVDPEDGTVSLTASAPIGDAGAPGTPEAASGEGF